MGVVVFDSDVLIGFLNGGDAHHQDAVATVRQALAPGTRRLLCAVNYAEILVGPTRAGRQDHVRRMLDQFGIDVVPVDEHLAERAAAVRVRTTLKLPDAFALATTDYARGRGWADVSLASFDAAVVKAHRALARAAAG